MANPHVALVIDNDDEVLQELKNMLESLGHQCYCASTQEGAERIMEKQVFCYVLLDLELPVSPNQIPKIQVGFNLLEVIRARYSKDKLPVIVITAHGKGHEYPVRAFKMGADDYVKKPFDDEPEPLEDKIREWTQKTCEKSHGDCPNLRAARGSKQKLAVPVKGKGADGKPCEAEPARPQPAGAADTEAEAEERRCKSWQDIKIVFLSEERIQIIRNGTPSESLNYGEFGFEDRRTGKPNLAWITLRALAESNEGILPDGAKTGQTWLAVEKRTQEIRKALRKRFGISGDPLLFIEGTGYQAQFKIGCSPSYQT